MKILAVLFAVSLFFLGMSSCGYHLRGAYQLPPPMAVTVIKSNNMKGELARSLKRGLETSGIFVVDDAVYKQPAAVLRILDEKHNKRVLSVDINGRVREYALHYELAMELSGPQDLLIPRQMLELTRDFTFNPEDVLGKSDEEAELLRDMQHDMVRLIMLRLQAATQKSTTPIDALPAP